MQKGDTVACGHCDKKFEEGLKLCEKSIPNFKCDCVCHLASPEVIAVNGSVGGEMKLVKPVIEKIEELPENYGIVVDIMVEKELNHYAVAIILRDMRDKINEIVKFINK